MEKNKEKRGDKNEPNGNMNSFFNVAIEVAGKHFYLIGEEKVKEKRQFQI